MYECVMFMYEYFHVFQSLDGSSGDSGRYVQLLDESSTVYGQLVYRPRTYRPTPLNAGTTGTEEVLPPFRLTSNPSCKTHVNLTLTRVKKYLTRVKTTPKHVNPKKIFVKTT